MSLFPHQHLRVSILCLFLSGMVMLFNSYIATAAEWSITPKVSFGGEYDDNFHFTTAGDDGVTGSSVAPEINFNRAEPDGAVSIGAQLKYIQYDNKEVSGTAVQYLTLKSDHKTQRSQWRLNGVLKSDTTQTTITDNSVPGDDETAPQDVDAGLIEVSVRRHQLNLEPSWRYALSKITSMTLGYGLTDVFYSNAEGTDLVDYRSHRVNTRINHQVDEKNTLGITAQFSRFRAPDSDSETDNLSLAATIDHKFLQDLKGNVSLGYRETTTTSATDEDKSDGVVLNIGLSKQQTQITSYNISLKRDIRSSGAGTEVQSDSLTIRLNHKMTPRLSTSLSVNAFDNETLGGDVSSVDRIYYSIEPGLQWAITRDWTINGSYAYRWQKRDIEALAAESNAVFVSLNYIWPKISASR